MKKIIYTALILLILFIGVLIGDQPSGGRAKEIKDRIEDFENEITDPNNDYDYSESIITPNGNNSIARRGDKIIKGIFDYSFGLLKGLIE
jgi:hypothetical protein